MGNEILPDGHDGSEASDPGLGSAQRETRSWRRLLWLVVPVAVIVGVILAVTARDTIPADDPAYSLRLLSEAAQARDWEGVRTYMDPGAVGLTFAEQTLARARGDQDDGSASGMGGSGDFPAGAMGETFTRQFVDSLEDTVADGTAAAEGSLFATILDEGTGDVEAAGENEALVTVTIAGDDEQEQDIRLRMVRRGERWVLVAIEDTTDLYDVLY